MYYETWIPVPTHRPRPWTKPAVLAVGLAATLGCGGDDPAKLAGTIELPSKKPARFDPKSFKKPAPRATGRKPTTAEAPMNPSPEPTP